MGQLIDCPHQGRHTHGTSQAYKKDNCRCDLCRTARAREAKRQRARAARGLVEPLVPITEARAHIATLTKAGIPLSTLAQDIGVSRAQLQRIRNGETQKVTPRLNRAILATPIPLSPRYDSRRISVHGARLRLQSLHAIGYDGITLARYLNMDVIGLRRTTNEDVYGAHTWITEGLHHRIDALYQRLWNQPPVGTDPASKRNITYTIRTAARKGWVPPMGLDEDRIDDPTYRPDPAHNLYRKAS